MRFESCGGPAELSPERVLLLMSSVASGRALTFLNVHVLHFEMGKRAPPTSFRELWEHAKERPKVSSRADGEELRNEGCAAPLRPWQAAWRR